MLLAIDIGNSNIVMAAWDDEWSESLRLDTHPICDAGHYRKQIEKWLNGEHIDLQSISSIILSSVVPAAAEPVVEACKNIFNINPLVLTANLDTGIILEAEQPERVGADLIADAAGAYALIQNTCIVVDFGTATTVMAVKNPGKLIGGAICAGLNVSIDALVGRTAQLPSVPVSVPCSPIGKNTVQAMQSGLVLGHICMVEGLIIRMKNEIGGAKVVATGGLVSLLAPHTDYFDYVEPLLTLNGLRFIAERQA